MTFPITYVVTPDCKKSTYSNECWEKTFDSVTVKLIISTQWRGAEFNVTVNTQKEDHFIKNLDDLVLNDYDFEFVVSYDACDITHEIENFDQLSENVKTQVKKDIYRNNDEIYEESVLEEKGWFLDDTIYEIYGGFTLQENN